MLSTCKPMQPKSHRCWVLAASNVCGTCTRLFCRGYSSAKHDMYVPAASHELVPQCQCQKKWGKGRFSRPLSSSLSLLPTRDYCKRVLYDLRIPFRAAPTGSLIPSSELILFAKGLRTGSKKNGGVIRIALLEARAYVLFCCPQCAMLLCSCIRSAILLWRNALLEAGLIFVPCSSMWENVLLESLCVCSAVFFHQVTLPQRCSSGVAR
jgi:hypothetical protein